MPELSLRADRGARQAFDDRARLHAAGVDVERPQAKVGVGLDRPLLRLEDRLVLGEDVSGVMQLITIPRTPWSCCSTVAPAPTGATPTSIITLDGARNRQICQRSTLPS